MSVCWTRKQNCYAGCQISNELVNKTLLRWVDDKWRHLETFYHPLGILRTVWNLSVYDTKKKQGQVMDKKTREVQKIK